MRSVSPMLTLPIEVPTNSTEPIGGVMSPSPPLRIKITPKCSGLIPIALATGRKMGVQMMTSGARSMNVPSASRMPIISRSSRCGSCVIPVNTPTAVEGTCRKLSNQPNDAAEPIRNTINPTVRTAPAQASRKP